jgi:uncharacterized protein DUF547
MTGGGLRTLIAVLLAGAAASGMQSRSSEVRDNKTLDEILEVHVRDGYVSYRALKTERNRLDAYVASLAGASLDSAMPAQQISFWLNAYNALVLQTVVDHYPIAQRTNEYPPRSIRQIPGAFERLQHRIAGKSVTLDQIEQTFLAAFHDPRVFLALGRGAAGSGRLRSEAYASDALERQLSEVASDCVNRAQCFQLDPIQNRVLISSIFSWRRNDFIDAYAGAAPEEFKARSPIELAVIAFMSPRMLASERQVLSKNTFKVDYLPFDWSLNDLSTRGAR